MTTIQDVARRAGVSISTVSYALSGKRRISEATRRRIEMAIDDLGYHPNAGARMLAGANSTILALSAPLHAEGHVPTQMRFVTEVVETARVEGFDILLLSSEDMMAGIQRVAASSLVGGVLVYGVGADDERAGLLSELKIPAGFIGVPDVPPLNAWCVDFDFESAARLAVRELAKRGHREIAVVNHPLEYVQRRAGFVLRFNRGLRNEAMATGVVAHSVAPSISPGAATGAVATLFKENPRITAVIFHCNEPVVQEVQQFLEANRLDVAMLGAATSYPGRIVAPLARIELPIEEMCRRVVRSTVGGVRGNTDYDVTLLPPILTDPQLLG